MSQKKQREDPSNLALENLINLTLELWPEHNKYLTHIFTTRTKDDIVDSNQIAELILKIAGPRLSSFIQSYRWMCEEFLEEQLHFARTGTYRFSHLSEIQSSIYGHPEYMTKYMDGLLLSQVYWNNHFRAISLFRHRFLKRNKMGNRHLEIGPGHGLLLYYAIVSGFNASVSTWDISETSLALTRNCIENLGVKTKIDMQLQDAMIEKNVHERFDSIVLSEVLEHVEKPDNLLKCMANKLAVGGSIFINVPVNSPAPDHIYLLHSPEEAIQLVKNSGLNILEAYYLPEANLTIEQAVKRKATISCVIIATS